MIFVAVWIKFGSEKCSKLLVNPILKPCCTQSIWNWGRGTWLKIKIYGPPAGRPRPTDSAAYGGLVRSPTAASSGRRIDRPRPACQLDEAAQQESSKNKTVRGHPAGPLQKSNCTRPHRGRTVYFDFWPSPPPLVPYGWAINGLFRTNCESLPEVGLWIVQRIGNIKVILFIVF